MFSRTGISIILIESFASPRLEPPCAGTILPLHCRLIAVLPNYILAVYDAAIDQLFRKGFQLQRFRQASADLKRVARRQEELP